MNGIKLNPFRTAAYYLSIGLLAASTLAFAQDSATDSGGGWKRVGDPPAASQDQAPPAPEANSAPQNTGYPAIQQPSDLNPQPNGPNQQPLSQPPPPGYGPTNNQSGYGQGGYNSGYQQPPAPQPVPAQLTIPAGTYITARVNQLLSSDKNQVGDAFSATLVQPIVVNGVVVAEPGQTIGGRVAEAQKAGRIEGVARLGLQLTTLTLVDGQQIPIQTQLISRKGPTSVGQDAGAIVGTTALGAAVGAAADWGRGAAIGAGAGAAVGIIGVLVTRGHPSIITPESVLTFRLLASVTVSTTNAPQAFRYVQPGEYEQPGGGGPGGYPGGPAYGPGYGAYASAAPPPPYYYYGYPYPYYYAGYPYYWWPGFGFYWGPSFYFRGYYGGRFYGGRYYGGAFYGHAGGGGHIAGGAVGHVSGGGGRR